MRPSRFLVPLALFVALSGCFERSPSGGPGRSQSNASLLREWSDEASLVLPGDTNVAAAPIRERWDSVVDLAEHADRVRLDVKRIASDWNSRRPKARGLDVVAVDSVSNPAGRTALVRCSVDGIEQGGLVWIPKRVGKLPVVLFGHPDDKGVGAETHLRLLAFLMDSLYAKTIVVAPAFRGETARLGSDSVVSDTTSRSPWDRDVDDGIALLDAVLASNHKIADASNIGAVGYSRGAGVALLTALRDRRIRCVYEIAGPTDFFARSLQTLAMYLFAGAQLDLPGVNNINREHLQPFLRGAISADSLRRVLLSKSPARLALSGLLPSTTAMHGAEDATVSNDQSEALKAAEPLVRYEKIPGMGHTSFVKKLFTGDPSEAMAISASMVPFLESHLY